MNQCVFCDLPESRIVYSTEHYVIIKDNYPVSPGHLLIITKKHRENYFELSQEEKDNLDLMIQKAKEIIEKEYVPDGYNIGMNCGKAAGQSVMHFHCHLIPRYKGDMADPKGGIRYCIPEKGKY